MKATTLLERQHRNLQQLCEAVERGSVSIRVSLLPQLASDLVAHIAVEDKIFYPAVWQTLRDDEWASRGRARHLQARRSLDRALDAGLDSDEFVEAMGSLRKVIESHAEEEEEALFPRMDRWVPQDAMLSLGRSMMELYHSTVESGYSRPTMPSLYPPETARP